ncbi:4-hydroxy-tetrahydrodipicolinate reductase [Shinella sp.]|uniref:4-hydroxy-tetrahydrodipicolinate reductase n=1 Tax=Shinella sp. TaxID=1870904 RepID=UPI0028B0B515|nr:4-hydroxy-tetrahydrodipicolinate reductase [Shinella sp.]
MTSPINVAVAGSRGRMGQTLVAALQSDKSFHYIGGIGRSEHEEAGFLSIEAALETADVIIDFSTAASATTLAERCGGRGGPALVIGATGFDRDEEDRIAAAAHQIPVLRSGNFSIGLNLLTRLISHMSATLPPDAWDIEITEAHHRRKVDAPSGTALMLGEAAAQGRAVSLESVERRGRDGMTGLRPDGEIGFSVVRGGGIVGEHSVMFAAEEEVITISHSALGRGMFARGALVAARWIAGKPPGAYTMADVLDPAGSKR